MSLINCCKVLFSSKVAPISVVAKRYRYHWEMRPENKWRKLLMQVTLPRLGPSPAYENKVEKEEDDTLYGLDVVLHREAKEMIGRSSMILVYLRSQMEITEYFRMRHDLRKMDIHVDDLPNHVMEYTLKGSSLEVLSNLYRGQTLTVFSEKTDVKNLLKITKKNPYILLMGGVIENRAMSAEQVIQYGKLPSLSEMHSQLSFTLMGHCSSTHNLLKQGQSMTASYLSQYIKDNENKT